VLTESGKIAKITKIPITLRDSHGSQRIIPKSQPAGAWCVSKAKGDKSLHE
jgi:hypothetical protein